MSPCQSYPTKDVNYRILARQRSRFTHYYFYIRDETLGPMVMRVASCSCRSRPRITLNGHSFIERELNRARIGFRKIDNAFLAVDDVAALQAACADRLSPEIIRQRLDYWTLILGPKFSAKERTRLNLSRFYAIAQIEYCRNFIFKRHFPIHKLFERSCELGLWRLTGDKIAAIFGTRVNRRMRGKLATIIDRAEHGHHVFRAYFKHAFLKQYEKFATYLRNELVSNNLADFHLRKGLDHLHAVRARFQTMHRSLRRLPGAMAQTSMSTSRCCNVSPSPSPSAQSAIPASSCTIRARHPPLRGPPARRQPRRRLDGQADPSGCPRHLPALRHTLRHQPTALRPAQTLKGHGLLQRDGSRYAYRLSPKRRPGCAAVPLLPQKTLRSARTQPFPPPPRRPSSAAQQIGNRVSPRRQSHPTDRRSACRVTFAATTRLLNAFGQGFAQVRSKDRLREIFDKQPHAAN